MGSQDSSNSKQLLKDNALMGVWVTSSKTKGLNIPLKVYGLKMQEANRFGNVSSGFLPHSKCLKNFSTCDQTQLQKIYKQSRETAKVIVEIQAARGQLCLRGRVPWLSLLGPQHHSCTWARARPAWLEGDSLCCSGTRGAGIVGPKHQSKAEKGKIKET